MTENILLLEIPVTYDMTYYISSYLVTYDMT